MRIEAVDKNTQQLEWMRRKQMHWWELQKVGWSRDVHGKGWCRTAAGARRKPRRYWVRENRGKKKRAFEGDDQKSLMLWKSHKISQSALGVISE